MDPGLRFLLIDDDDNDLTLFRLAISKTHWRVAVDGCCNGQNAIECLEQARKRSHLPDVIVLDLRMPPKDGFDFLAWRAGSDFAELPVIVLTGLGDCAEKERALALGASLVLEKPLRFAQLVEVVSAIGSFAMARPKASACAPTAG